VTKDRPSRLLVALVGVSLGGWIAVAILQLLWHTGRFGFWFVFIPMSVLLAVAMIVALIAWRWWGRSWLRRVLLLSEAVMVGVLWLFVWAVGYPAAQLVGLNGWVGAAAGGVLGAVAIAVLRLRDRQRVT